MNTDLMCFVEMMLAELASRREYELAQPLTLGNLQLVISKTRTRLQKEGKWWRPDEVELIHTIGLRKALG